MSQDDLVIFLIAPNVGEQMGGEAMKALQIFQELRRAHPQTFQITHRRNYGEVHDRLRLDGVYFVDDDPLMIALWRSRMFSSLVDSVFARRAIDMAERLVKEMRFEGRHIVIHQTEPNSPVTPRPISRLHSNVFGPINGNIYYPHAFRAHESTGTRARRLLHMPVQRLNRWFASRLKQADLILCAGGARTADSLASAGCPASIIKPSLDCGVRDELLERPRVLHQEPNLRFLHYGRLVFHKGTALVIEALSKTRQPICLDVVGRGPELEPCRRLAADLGLGERVRFLGWYERNADLFESFASYRGVLLPSLEDANGIVVQEALASGLPAICLDWGGPQLLVDDGVDGFLVEPRSREYIVDELARRLDQLASDPALAESMSVAGRAKAAGWRWAHIIEDWLAAYRALPRRGDARTPSAVG